MDLSLWLASTPCSHTGGPGLLQWPQEPAGFSQAPLMFTFSCLPSTGACSGTHKGSSAWGLSVTQIKQLAQGHLAISTTVFSRCLDAEGEEQLGEEPGPKKCQQPWHGLPCEWGLQVPQPRKWRGMQMGNHRGDTALGQAQDRSGYEHLNWTTSHP